MLIVLSFVQMSLPTSFLCFLCGKHFDTLLFEISLKNGMYLPLKVTLNSARKSTFIRIVFVIQHKTFFDFCMKIQNKEEKYSIFSWWKVLLLDYLSFQNLNWRIKFWQLTIFFRLDKKQMWIFFIDSIINLAPLDTYGRK